MPRNIQCGISWGIPDPKSMWPVHIGTEPLAAPASGRPGGCCSHEPAPTPVAPTPMSCNMLPLPGPCPESLAPAASPGADGEIGARGGAAGGAEGWPLRRFCMAVTWGVGLLVGDSETATGRIADACAWHAARIADACASSHRSAAAPPSLAACVPADAVAVALTAAEAAADDAGARTVRPAAPRALPRPPASPAFRPPRPRGAPDTLPRARPPGPERGDVTLSPMCASIPVSAIASSPSLRLPSPTPAPAPSPALSSSVVHSQNCAH